MTIDDIGEDIEADQSNQFHCDQCNQYFVLKEHLDKHENEVHCMDKEPSDNAEDMDPDSVKSCDDIAKDPSDSAENIVEDEANLSDGRKKFSCNQCKKSYLHKSDLQRHMKRDHDSFSCEVCNQSFSKLTDSKKHTNQFCHFCMKLIGTQLKRHIKFEHQDIRYSCDKSFHRQGVLERQVKS